LDTSNNTSLFDVRRSGAVGQENRPNFICAYAIATSGWRQVGVKSSEEDIDCFQPALCILHCVPGLDEVAHV
jgi:hypothetical protein